MSSSPAERTASALRELEDALGRAARAFADGDLQATAEAITRGDAALATVLRCQSDATPPAAALARVTDRHTRLLAAVAGERDRLAVELAKARASRRALRSYGWRRPAEDAGRAI